jgi:hypothetical protein
MKFFVLALMLLFAPVHALATEPYARAAIVDEGAIVAGQQVYLAVDVFAPNFFTSPPQFPLFQLPNALVTLPEERTQNLNESAGGTQFSGIRRRYAIVPEIPGDYHLPAIEIEFGYSVDGKATKGVARTTPLTFSAGGNAGAPAAFAARNVTIEQTFDRPPNALNAGDAVVRTIAITAENTQGIVIPPSAPGTAPGLTQYAKAAKTEDGISVGNSTVSRRTETLVYTSTTEGQFEIPAIEYPWFDLDRHTMAIARLPATDVFVAPAAASTGIAPEAAPAYDVAPFQRRRQAMFRIALILGMAALAWILWNLAKRAYPHLTIMHDRIIASRRNRLRLLRQSILTDKPPEVYVALQRWSLSEGYRTLQDWAGSIHPDLAADMDGLEGLLYSSRGGNFDRQRMARLVARNRASPLRQRARPALPELNPTH